MPMGDEKNAAAAAGSENIQEEIQSADKPKNTTALVEYVPAPKIECRLECEHSFASIVTASTLAANDAEQQARRVAKEFNRGVTHPVIVDADVRSGSRVDPGRFLVAHMNRVPEVCIGTGDRKVLRLTGPYTETGYLCPKDGVPQTDLLIGGYGSFIVNVPTGMVAKAWSGNTPFLLGEGPHVIHDATLRVEPGLVSLSAAHISHGVIHVLRVPVGYVACVKVDTKPHLLAHRAEAYCFVTPLFEFDNHSGFVAQTQGYINYDTMHLVRVPAGAVGRAWLGSKAIMLEHREEPYFFEDPCFRLERPSGPAVIDRYFEDARQKLIKHGNISRLWPGVRGDLELAVVQCDGETRFLDRRTTLDDHHHAVIGFINMGIQTEIFPSKATRDERRRESRSMDEVQYEPVTTRDSLKIGVKLLVAYQVVDAAQVLKKLRLEDLHPHVEGLAASDIARVVQNSTSQNFLASTSSVEGGEETEKSIADSVRVELEAHLQDCGLRLVRFNIEEAKVLDEELSREMAKQTLLVATASAQQATIEQKAAVAKANAELEAMERRVRQEQDNQIKISAAQADLDAARIKAEATLIAAEAKQKAAQMEGAQYRAYPELLQLHIAQLQMQSLQSSTVNLVSPDVAHTPFGLTAQGAAGLFSKSPKPDAPPQ